MQMNECSRTPYRTFTNTIERTRPLFMFVHLTNRAEFLVHARSFIRFTNCSLNVRLVYSPTLGYSFEVAIIKHPSAGEYAFGFITSTLVLRKNLGGEELCCVYVPTNHLYMGDIVLVNSKDVMRPDISVREGIGKR
ncbi:hypothetical protein Hanom_Chr11g00975061 [Helianthus anomalus]